MPLRLQGLPSPQTPSRIWTFRATLQFLRVVLIDTSLPREANDVIFHRGCIGAALKIARKRGRSFRHGKHASVASVSLPFALTVTQKFDCRAFHADRHENRTADSWPPSTSRLTPLVSLQTRVRGLHSTVDAFQRTQQILRGGQNIPTGLHHTPYFWPSLDVAICVALPYSVVLIVYSTDVIT